MEPQSIVHNCDCMEYMRTVPDKHFALAIVDPPYFSGPERREFYGRKVSPIGVQRLYAKTETWGVPDKEYFDELLRISQHYIIWGCNYYDYQFAHGRIVWDKCNGTSSFSDAELAATDLFDSVRMFRFMWNGMLQGESLERGHVMQGNKAKNEKRIHPTQKPVALYAWLLQNYAKPSDNIFDSHLGSGSSRIAAYKLGFDFVGCEIDKGYYESQEKRFQEECKDTVILPNGKQVKQLSIEL